MKIDVSDELPLPADEVFLLLRDRMPELVPYLQDIESITVTHREEDGDTVHIVNLWRAGLDKVPQTIRRFFKPELVSWNDHAVWTTEDRAARWRLEPRVGAAVFECSGMTRVEELEPRRCRLVIDIDLVIHPERVPGVPKLLARKFSGRVEQTIASTLTPNMRHLAASVNSWAKDRG